MSANKIDVLKLFDTFLNHCEGGSEEDQSKCVQTYCELSPYLTAEERQWLSLSRAADEEFAAVASLVRLKLANRNGVDA